WELLGRLFTAGGAAPLVTPAVLLTIGGSIALQFLPRDWYERLQRSFSKLAPAGQAACLAVGLVALDAFGPAGVAPFIYFRFWGGGGMTAFGTGMDEELAPDSALL